MRELQTSNDYYTAKAVMQILRKGQRVIGTMVQDGRLPKPSKDGPVAGMEEVGA